MVPRRVLEKRRGEPPPPSAGTVPPVASLCISSSESAGPVSEGIAGTWDGRPSAGLPPPLLARRHLCWPGHTLNGSLAPAATC